MKKCGLYVRVSTDMQALVKDGSLDTQVDTLRKYADVKSATDDDGWEIAEVYREEGKSGKNTDRPAYQRMLTDIRAGRVNAILCTKIDRISRSLIDFYEFHGLLEQHGVTFVSLHENWDTSTPMGRFGLKLTLAVAELEREQTAERVREKMAWRAEEGLWNGGQVLGYDLVPDKKGVLAANEREAQVVRFTFEQYLKTPSTYETARVVNAAGHRTKSYRSRRGLDHEGKPFTKTDVARILRNPIYIGKIRQKGQLFAGRHEPIIPMELWNLVQNRLPKARRGQRKFGRRRSFVFKLRGFVRCGACDGMMTPSFGTGRNGVHFYYRCVRRSDASGRCNVRLIPAAALEQLVIDRIKELNRNPALIREVIAAANTTFADSLKKREEERGEALRQLSLVDDRLRKLIDFIGDGKTTATLREELLALEDRKRALKERIASLDGQIAAMRAQQVGEATFRENLQLFERLWARANDDDRAELLRLQIHAVIYGQDELRVGIYALSAESASSLVQRNGTNGAPRGTRTHDPLIKNQLLYQLS